ncbi:primary-amine oxidase [Geosmithia morbida]|uniref:Amine oxidase n=1 Tax=Geosmithia morbida TaxID=1094350 RepID=A0A9P5D3I1_9HYPO|nr:primary-amine oxidase [Geosmithia morbida]KAF4126213.1 primary-amine oxidase [Geosmithia morbida]
MAPHPLDPLTPAEIRKTASIVRSHFTGHEPNFRVITLKEPSKKDMVPFLEDYHTSGKYGTRPPREARVQVIARVDDDDQFVELIVNLDLAVIASRQHLKGKHSYIDAAYMKSVEKACISDPRIQEEIKTLHLPEGATVCVEPWAYATDGMIDTAQRTSMCWFYMRLLDSPDANYYAYPLDLCAEVSEQLRVTKIYRLPSAADERIHDRKQPYDKQKVHDASASEYHPDLRPPPRHTTRPYQVVQPEGPSFTSDGNAISWEKWTLRVGFNYREGLTLHDVRYDGRSVFYRLSLSEMFVPYGDPRTPYPRKGAFDLGNDGAGINANDLQLGCDCLGTIKYFDAWHNTSTGEPMKLPNVVCCHEQDDGILWKHTNFRTQNAVVTRSRILVLQTIITVSNYEYIFAFQLGQDASIHYEVRATGILSTAPINITDSVPYGTIVAPGVLAPYHQHLFCLRIDPAIDGHANSLQVEETEPMAPSEGENPIGVGYVTKSRVVEDEQGLDLDFNKNRVFKMINEKRVNPITRTPVGFKIIPCYSQMLLAHPSSYHARRSEFGQHAVWVTRYDDEEIFPSGRHTMQSTGGEGIASGIERRKASPGTSTSVRDEDIVVWHTFGSTHNPRIEDWPVMPADKMVVGLKPVNFFTGNPGIDVAVSTQEKNRSVLVTDASCCEHKL